MTSTAVPGQGVDAVAADGAGVVDPAPPAPNTKTPFFSLRTTFRLVSWLVIASIASYRYFVASGGAFSASCKIFRYNCPPTPSITGFLAPEYGPLARVFGVSWADGDEVGASFTAYVDGERVAELYGGFTDTTYSTPYSANTLQMVFSSSKAVTGIAIMFLVERGILDLDRRIAEYWPEFAEGGKEKVTLRDLMRHRAGVPYLDKERVPTPEDTMDLDRLASLIAGQPHAFGGKKVSAYHATTRGWFLNEVVRRAHPEGKSLREVMNEDILPLIQLDGDNATTPFEFHYGLSEDEYPTVAPRVAPFISYPVPMVFFRFVVPPSLHKVLGTLPLPKAIKNAYFYPTSVQALSLLESGPRFENPRDWPNTYNNVAILKGHGPSYGGFTSSRTLARFAAYMVNNGSLSDGTRILDASTVALATKPGDTQVDEVIGLPISFTSAGFGVFPNFAESGETWIGWAGAGGSVVMWSPRLNMAISYVMNFPELGSLGDRRSHRMARTLTKIVSSLKDGTPPARGRRQPAGSAPPATLFEASETPRATEQEL